MITDSQIQLLIQKASEAKKYAFVPNSDHKFGACVLSSDGNYYDGCTVESVISGLGSCAERVAIDHAVTHGKYCFEALVVVSDSLIYPCGACLQYLAQFYQVTEQELFVIVANEKGEYNSHTLFELLPYPYLSIKQKNKIKAYKCQK